MDNFELKGVDTFWYENGNTGYMKLALSIIFMDGKADSYIFNTGLSSSNCYDDTPLVDLEILFDNELTERGRKEFNELISKQYWKDAVIMHDTSLLECKKEFIMSLQDKLESFKNGV